MVRMFLSIVKHVLHKLEDLSANLSTYLKGDSNTHLTSVPMHPHTLVIGGLYFLLDLVLIMDEYTEFRMSISFFFSKHFLHLVLNRASDRSEDLVILCSDFQSVHMLMRNKRLKVC